MLNKAIKMFFFSGAAKSTQERESASSHDIISAGLVASRSAFHGSYTDAMAAMSGPLIGDTTMGETLLRQLCPQINLCLSHGSRQHKPAQVSMPFDTFSASTSTPLGGVQRCAHIYKHPPCRCELEQASKHTCNLGFKFHNPFDSLQAL